MYAFIRATRSSRKFLPRSVAAEQSVKNIRDLPGRITLAAWVTGESVNCSRS